jgi:hypothetical protein
LKVEAGYELLKGTMEKVEQQYCHGRPPHHLDEAQRPEFSNQRSKIFVTTPERLQQLTVSQVQEIFRHRHILVAGGNASNVEFDHKALSRLGSLEALHTIQGV